MTKKELETLEIIIPDGKLKGCLVYHEAIIDLINTLLKEQRAEILKDLKKAQILADKEQALETDIFLQNLIKKLKL